MHRGHYRCANLSRWSDLFYVCMQTIQCISMRDYDRDHGWVICQHWFVRLTKSNLPKTKVYILANKHFQYQPLRGCEQKYIGMQRYCLSVYFILLVLFTNSFNGRWRANTAQSKYARLPMKRGQHNNSTLRQWFVQTTGMVELTKDQNCFLSIVGNLIDLII